MHMGLGGPLEISSAQHILKQGHLAGIQVCGSGGRGGGGGYSHASDLFTIPRENVPFHHGCIPVCICPYVFVSCGSGENAAHGHVTLSHPLG